MDANAGASQVKAVGRLRNRWFIDVPRVETAYTMAPENRSRRQIMKIKSEKDFFCGVMFVVVGIAFAWASTNYKIGTSARMGPG